MSESPLVALNVKSSPSTSEPLISNVNDVSSSIVWSSRSAITGASFTGVTSSVNVPEPDAWPSLAVIDTTRVPL